MKIKILFLSVLSSLCLPLAAQEIPPLPQKIYCKANQIEVSDETIFIHLEDQTFEAERVQVDQGGIYCTESMLRCIDCRRPINYKHLCDRSVK